MCLNESLVNTDRHLRDDLKKTMFENSVLSNSQLRASKDQADQTNTHNQVEN